LSALAALANRHLLLHLDYFSELLPDDQSCDRFNLAHFLLDFDEVPSLTGLLDEAIEVHLVVVLDDALSEDLLELGLLQF